MDKKLRQLFDFQKFEAHPDLQSVIDDVHSRYESRELNMDEMEMVSAAGVLRMTGKKNKPENKC